MVNQKIDDIHQELAEIAGTLWQKGWAERNAGNISVDITAEYKSSLKNNRRARAIEFKRVYPALGGHALLLTGTGTRMRRIAKDPEAHTCLLMISSDGKKAQVVGIDDPTIQPTSEFPTHLAIHQMLAEKDAPEKIIIHTHPDELIALSHLPAYKKETEMNNLLWAMHPETVIVLPQGIGFIPYEVLGTEELAAATAGSLKNHKVAIWEKHGVVSIGKTIIDAFDNIDAMNKAAVIFFLCKNAGFEPEGLSVEQISRLRKVFADADM